MLTNFFNDSRWRALRFSIFYFYCDMIIYALMLPDENLQAATRLAESNNRNQTRPAVFSGMSVGSFPEQRLVIELISRTAAGNRAYNSLSYNTGLWKSKSLPVISLPSLPSTSPSPLSLSPPPLPSPKEGLILRF